MYSTVDIQGHLLAAVSLTNSLVAHAVILAITSEDPSRVERARQIALAMQEMSEGMCQESIQELTQHIEKKSTQAAQGLKPEETEATEASSQRVRQIVAAIEASLDLARSLKAPEPSPREDQD
jgi:LPS O-antigen subunit length determinant protein (WzzB/FepE family)